MSDRVKDLLKTVWICCTVAAVFTDAGIMCLLPAVGVTAFAMLD